MDELLSNHIITRRSFIRGSILATGAVAGLGKVSSNDLLEPVLAQEKKDAAGDKVVPTICGGCHNDCGMLVHVRDGIIRYIEGNPDHPFNRGALCPKGSAMLDIVYSPSRLKAPLKRVGERGEDKWQEISWDEALDIIAARLSEIAQKYGPETLLYSTGAPVMNIVRNAFMEFYARYGTPNQAAVNHLCFAPRVTALMPTYGFRDEEDYNNTKLIINWGGNPFASMRPGSYMAYGREGFLSPILDAMANGAKLIVIDPVCTETATKADKWLPIRPGTDGALVLAMLNVIINEKLYDSDFVEKWTTGFEELSMFVKDYSPAWASKITWIAEDDIYELARLYATTKPALIHEANTFANHTNCVQTTRAIGILKAITGNLDVPGGNVCFTGTLGDITPIEQGSPVSIKTTVKPPAPHLAAKRYPLLPAGLPASIDAIETGKPYSPRAMMIYHTNPLLSSANYHRLKENLSKLEFVVVVDIFETRTALELADLILPDCTFLERYDYRIYPSEKGAVVALRQPAIEPLYESRTAYWMEYNLAQRMGFAEGYPWTNDEEFINYALKPGNINLDSLRKQPVQIVGEHHYKKYELGLLRPDGQQGFNTPSGKVELFSSVFKNAGYDPLPAYQEPAEGPVSTPDLWKEYSLIGVNRRPVYYVHFKYRNIPYLRNLHPYPEVTLNSQDADSRGLNEGEWVEITSPRGKVKMILRISPQVNTGVAWIEGGWGNPWDFSESNMNVLVDDIKRDPISQSSAISSFICQVGKLTE